jgi:hypothetical protein
MAADTQDRLPIFDYHVISDGGPPPPDPDPGDSWDEPVWKEEPPEGSWRYKEKEDPIGTVTIHAKGPAEDPGFDAVFKFTALPCEIKVDGKAPREGDRRWRGKGKANAEGCGRKKKIDFEFRNPKRW